ncbi:uncharacterized protein LOC129228035 [Uloborus diversus]|uniref:uncharacterized protein LOC129228035 n=1 Tax=Uloborus diversus TaxID=327109 RepID=UPI002409B497|nr:uncharacterized protein LOC129228035 [Uloborus diversus]
MFSFAIDVHKNILSAQCYIRCKTSNAIDKMLVIVQRNFLEISFYSGAILHHELKLFYPPNFFIPTTFHSLEKAASVYTADENVNCQVKSEYEIKQNGSESSNFELSFRLQISNDSLIDKTLLKPNSVLNFRNLLKTLLKPNIPYNIVCSKCKNILNKSPVEFNSIEDFHFDSSELSESWFCHSYIEAKSEVLKSNACYISMMFVHLHQSIVEHLHMRKCDKYYECNDCSTVLSSSKTRQAFIPFFCDAMTFKTTDESSSQQSCDNITRASFHNLIESSLQSSFSSKLYLYCKTANGEKCILLWITSQKVAQSLLHFKLEDMPNEMHLETKEVFKVLYCVPPFNSEIEKSWKHDCIVDYNNISENMLDFIMGLLESSSKYFPKLENANDDFKVGYLPA